MMKATVPTEAVGCIIDGGQEATMEILVYTRPAREAKTEILVDDSVERLQGSLLNEVDS